MCAIADILNSKSREQHDNSKSREEHDPTRLSEVVFRPIQGRHEAVRNDETGIEISLRSAPDYQYGVLIRFPGEKELHLFSIAIEPKFPDRPFTGPDTSNPTIEVLVGSMEQAAKFWGKSREENTRFVRFVLEGLSAINRLRPLSRSPYFYTDIERYKGRESIFAFNLPSEEEIAQL